jgi:3-phenylpropionate/cinnamic acid dioxygenase small subunit
MPVSTDDYVAISDLLGRYCWAVDSGDEIGWSSLWTEDCVFAGAMPEPLMGREAMKMIPRSVSGGSGGKLRHLAGSLHCDYDGADSNVIIARYYNLVSNWSKGGALSCFGTTTLRLVRDGGGWLIARSDTEMLT